MPQDTQDVLHEIRESIASIKTTIENIMPTVDLKLQTIEEKLKVANHRIEDLEDQNKWLWRTVVGGIICCIVAMYFK